jgi:hypothetical protein
MKAGYAVPLAKTLGVIGVSAFDRGLPEVVAAAVGAGSQLQLLQPISETGLRNALTRAVKALGSIGLADAAATLSQLQKGYPFGWLGDAQRIIMQTAAGLADVDQTGLDDSLRVQLASIAADLEQLSNALGVTEELKGSMGQVHGIEPQNLEVVREVAKETEGNVEAADSALEAADPDIAKERSTERYDRDNPDQEVHPAEVSVMTGSPGGGVPARDLGVVDRSSRDPKISRAVRNMPRIEKQTGQDADLWGAPPRGGGRRALGPTTEELDTLDQGQHPGYGFNRRLRGEPEMGKAEVDPLEATNRGVATTGVREDPDAVVDYSRGPHEPRWPDGDDAGEVHKDMPAQWAQDRTVDPSRVRNLRKDPATDEPVRVSGAGVGRDGYFEDQGPADTEHPQPVREREFDSRGAVRDEGHSVPVVSKRLRMGDQDAAGLFKLHASMWSRYVTDKSLTLAVVRLNNDGEIEVIDVAGR